MYRWRGTVGDSLGGIEGASKIVGLKETDGSAESDGVTEGSTGVVGEIDGISVELLGISEGVIVG